MKKIFFATALLLITPELFSQSTDEIMKTISLHLSNNYPDSAQVEIKKMKKRKGQLSNENEILAYLKVASFYSINRKVKECTETLQYVDGLIKNKSISSDSINYILNFIKGSNFIQQYKAEETIAVLKKSRDIYYSQDYSDSIQLASLYGNLANAHYIMFQYDSSAKYYKKLIPLLNSESVIKELGPKSYWSIALYYNSKGLSDSALLYYQKVVEIIGDPNEQNVGTHIAMNTNRSIELRKVDRFEEAFEFSKESLLLYSKFNLDENDQTIIDFRYELAEVYRSLGHNHKAIRLYNQVREIESSIYGRTDIHNAYNYVGIGNAFQNLGEFDSALNYYGKAMKIANLQESNLTYYKGTINQLKGNLYYQMNKANEALYEYHLALIRSQSDNDPNVAEKAEIGLRIALTHYMLEDFDSTKYYLYKSVKANVFQGSLDTRSIPQIESQVYSISLILESILLSVKLDLLDSENNVGILCTSFLRWRDKFDLTLNNSNDLTQLVNIQDKLIETLVESGVKSDFMVPLLFKLHESNHNKLLVNELELKNTRRSILPRSTRITINSIDQSIAFQKNELFKSLPHNKYDNELKLQSYIKDREAMLTQLKKSNPSYYEIRFGSTENLIKETRLLLTKNQVAIKFIQTEKSMAAILITSDKLRLFRLDYMSIDSLSNEFKKLVSKPDNKNIYLKDYSVTANLLFQKLFGLFYNEIETKEFIIFPDGSLRLIPFEALVVDLQNNITSYKELDYLISHNSISYLHSVKASILSKKLILGDKNEIAIFNPKYDGNENLNWTNNEAESIKDNFEIDLYEDHNASKDVFLNVSSQFRFIHFAGHAELNDEKPLSSYLRFTESKSSDSHLTCSEIYKLPISCEMIVLSACETGKGAYHKGEGMISLARAFFYAGAKSVIMSLWKANDHTTSLIMRDFYAELSQGKQKHLALQKAKIKYLDKSNEINSHPFYWSTFIANGDMSSIKSKKKFDSYWTLLIIFSLLVPVIWEPIVSKIIHRRHD
jgi:CHAT domain-containing protein